jgi:ABC-2 type transport system permease protein
MKNRIIPLMQREWLQHRNGWFLLAGVPLALTLLMLITGVGNIQFDGDTIQKAGAAFPAFLSLATMAGTAVVIFAIVWLSSLLITSGLARRDHADRSVEFWLSVPTSHSQSLGVPLLVHMILVPAAALVVGLLGGYVISAVAVTRLVGFSDLAALPWGHIIGSSIAITLRMAVGLLLATLWLSPLILLIVLLTAWFRRWAWVILAVGLGLGGLLLKQLFGQPLLSDLTAALFKHAGQSFISGKLGMTVEGSEGAFEAIRALPSWLAQDALLAVRDLASPLLLGALLFSAACFYLLVQWRQRGASATD